MEVINAAEFDNGGIRIMAADLCLGHEFVVFMTQEAILEGDEALSKIIGGLHYVCRS